MSIVLMLTMYFYINYIKLSNFNYVKNPMLNIGKKSKKKKM